MVLLCCLYWWIYSIFGEIVGMIFVVFQFFVDCVVFFVVFCQDVFFVVVDVFGDYCWDVDMVVGILIFMVNDDLFCQFVIWLYFVVMIVFGFCLLLWVWVYLSGDLQGIVVQLCVYGEQYGIVELIVVEVLFFVDVLGDEDWIVQVVYIIGGVVVEFIGCVLYYFVLVGNGMCVVFLFDVLLFLLMVVEVVVVLFWILFGMVFFDVCILVWDFVWFVGWIFIWMDEFFFGVEVVDVIGIVIFCFDEQVCIVGIEFFFC